MSDIVEKVRQKGAICDCDILIEVATEIERLQIALCESLVLQSHYATLLNRFDDGDRLTFTKAADWIERLRLIGRIG